MADAVTTQKLLDGPRNAVIKFTNVSDGTGESAVLKVDVSALTAFQGKACTGVNIMRVTFVTTGMKVRLLWDATADELIMELPEDSGGELCFDNPLPKTSAAGATGDILFTTTGHDSGDCYTVILDLEKVYG